MSKINTSRIRFKGTNIKKFRCKSDSHDYFYNCGKSLGSNTASTNDLDFQQ